LKNFIDYGKYNNDSLFIRIGDNARRKMFAHFMNCVKPSATDTVLDVGVTPNNGPSGNNFFEKLYPYTQNITMCAPENAAFLEQDFPGAKFVRNIPGKPLPFTDKQFDIVVSWAVLEHTGDHPQQLEFLSELLRVGKRLYLTTPNRWFPVEIHTVLPFVHWFPRKIHQQILRKLGMNFYADTNNLNLLTATNLMEMLRTIIPPLQLFYKIYFHRIFWLPSNIILYVSAKQEVCNKQRIVNLIVRFPPLRNIPADSVYKLVWYAIIGVITFVIANVCLYIFRRVLFLADVPSIALSYALTMVCHFLLHNTITFKESNEPIKNRLGGHLIVSIVNYFIGVGVTAVIIKFVVDNNIIATGCSIMVTLLLGYAMLNRFVYKTYKTAQGDKANDNHQKSA